MPRTYAYHWVDALAGGSNVSQCYALKAASRRSCCVPPGSAAGANLKRRQTHTRRCKPLLDKHGSGKTAARCSRRFSRAWSGERCAAVTLDLAREFHLKQDTGTTSGPNRKVRCCLPQKLADALLMVDKDLPLPMAAPSRIRCIRSPQAG